MKYLLLVLIPVIAFSVGCGTPYVVGKPIEKAKVDQMVPGTTKEDKVMEMFGQPEKKEMTPAGETKYTYSYFEVTPRFFWKDREQKNILEVYTKNGTVLKYDFRREGVSRARD